MASSVDAKLLKSTKFPPEFSQKVDMQKVNVEVMKRSAHIQISAFIVNDADQSVCSGGLLVKSQRCLEARMMW